VGWTLLGGRARRIEASTSGSGVRQQEGNDKAGSATEAYGHHCDERKQHRPSHRASDRHDVQERGRPLGVEVSADVERKHAVGSTLATQETHQSVLRSDAVEVIKTGIVNDWIASLNRKGLQPKTVHDMWKMFRAVMNWHLQQNDEPQRKWYPTLPVIPEDEQRWSTQEEIGRIVDAASGQYRVLFHLAGFSGLRAGELFGLHVEDLELNRGIVRVRRSVWRGKEVSTKTKKGYRNVLIDSGTFQILRQHLGTRTSGRVFQSRSASPLDTSNVLSEVLYPLCDRLLIPRGGLHAFRHGRVSHLQTSGVPADFTKSQVGHSSLRMTSNYTHFSEQFQRETVERLASKSMFCTQPSDLYSVAMPAKAV